MIISIVSNIFIKLQVNFTFPEEESVYPPPLLQQYYKTNNK